MGTIPAVEAVDVFKEEAPQLIEESHKEDVQEMEITPEMEDMANEYFEQQEAEYETHE